MAESTDASSARERLLHAAIDHLAAHGLADTSLRAIAKALGTSHRMLIYHFGSREGLLVEVVRTVEARQREALAGLRARSEADPRELARAFWRGLTDPALAPYERLFFELYGRALHGQPYAAGLLDGVVEDWLDPIMSVLRGQGRSERAARADARLGVAVTRGLLLDLLATGDRAAVDAAFERFLDAFTSPGPATAE